MAKKHVDTVDLRAELKKRVKHIVAELDGMRYEEKQCVNERAHLKQYFTGVITQAEAELDYLQGLLDG